MKTKLFIALPVYGDLNPFFVQSLLKLLDDPPCPICLRMCPGDSLVCRARNSLTADFLESDCTDLLFIDTDLIFGVDQVARIISHYEPVVGGFYPKKQEGDLQWVCNACLEDKPILANGLQEVRYMGTGFLHVKRFVLEYLVRSGMVEEYKQDHSARVEHDFWSVGVYRYNDGSSRYLSEDWYFCQRCIDAGYQVWGDTKVVLKHVGQAIYPLQSQQKQLFGREVLPPRPKVAGPVSSPPQAGDSLLQQS